VTRRPAAAGLFFAQDAFFLLQVVQSSWFALPLKQAVFFSTSDSMDDDIIRIYHNKRCSKSRGACQVIAAAGLSAEVIDYLNDTPSRDELIDILALLGMRPAEIVRRGEAVFKEHYAERILSDEEWLDALLAHPILIERPIVVRGGKAVIGRPPEKVLELL